MTNALSTGRYGRVNPGPGFGDEYSYTDDVVLTAAQDGAVINYGGGTHTFAWEARDSTHHG